MTPTDLARASAAPVLATGGLRTLDVTTTDGSITLAAGAHEVFNGGAVTAYLRLGSGVSIPASGGAAVAGQFPVPAGAVATFVTDGSAAVYGLTASSTTTLDFMRKPL